MSILLDELRAKKLPAEMIQQLENLPPSLTLRRIVYYPAAPDIVRQKRGAFNGHFRAEFLKHVGGTCARNLRDMGLDDAAIDRMRHEGVLSTHNAAAANCTVDHILSLSKGGDNNLDNLMLLPLGLHKLKNNLEDAQPATSIKQSEVITIVPKTPGDKVPFILNGYTRSKALVS